MKYSIELTLCTLACLLSLSPTVSAQLEIEADQRYLFLATERTGTMEEELNEAATLGFRIVTGSPTSENEIAIFLERVATPPDVYEYKLLATTRTGTMQEELSEAAEEGFRLLPRTMMSKTGRWMGNKELVAVLERSPDPDAPRYEYLLLATTLTGTLEDEFAQAVDDGFSLAGLASRDEHVAILERIVP